MRKDPIFRFFSIWDDAALQNTIAQCLKFTKNVSFYNTNYILFSKQKYLKNSQYEQIFFLSLRQFWWFSNLPGWKSLQLSSTFQRMSECESIKVLKLEHQQQKHFCVWENSTSVTVQLIPLVISLGTIDTVVAFLLLGKFNSTFPSSTSLQKVLHTRKRS